MSRLLEFLAEQKLFLVVALIFSALFYFFSIDRAQVELEIVVKRPTVVKIYWSGEDGLFHEKRRAYAKVKPGKTFYRFYLTDLAPLSKLRIDPLRHKGTVLLKRITITQKGFVPLNFQTEEEFARLKPNSHIHSATYTKNGLTIVSRGGDPFFNFDFTPEQGPFPVGQILLYLLAAYLAIYLVCSALQSSLANFSYVPLFLAAAFGLVVVMASISPREVHPDEYVHLSASTYYEDHWLPPKIDDPAIRNTFSVYGVSRLNSPEIYYFFAGKFLKFIGPLGLENHLALRLFNVSLFGLLLLCAMSAASSRSLLLGLLVSSQLWYVFSYCNSDAFAVFIALIVGCQFCIPDSGFNRLIRDPGGGGRPAKIVGFGFLLGLLFLVKQNYYPYIIFLFIVLLWDLYTLGDHSLRISAIKRIGAIVLISLAVVGVRFGADYHVNGLDRKAKILEIREERAKRIYKPSTPLVHKHPFLHKKARGTTVRQMVERDRWFGKTFYSGFGSYGYFSATGPRSYYQLVQVVGGAFFMFLVGSILMRGGWGGFVLTSSALTLSTLMIGVSFYHSWVGDFQAQGRYLFPLVPMFGMLLARFNKVLQPHLLCGFVVVLFSLALYSFVWVGLLNIEKII